MITKILITEECCQLILKPETDFEKEVCKMFENFPNVYRGDFGTCLGGYDKDFGSHEDLIIRFSKKTKDVKDEETK